MKLISKYKDYHYQVKSYQSDQNGLLKVDSLFHFMQEVAWDHAKENNFGYESLKEKNAFWVLSRVKVVVEKYPEWQDEITVRTWPKGTESFFAKRDFQFSHLGNKIINATSYWLIVDHNHRRPKKPSDFNLNELDYHPYEAMPDRLIKININMNASPKFSTTYSVLPSDMDVNHHVNNATYIRWFTDLFLSQESNHSICEFEINYLLECGENESVTINIFKTEKDYCGNIIRSSDQKEICRFRFKTKKEAT